MTGRRATASPGFVILTAVNGTASLLYGRDQELARLRDLIDRISDRGGALVLRGEAGIGKSALISQAAARARERGLSILTATGVQSEARFAFAGLHQLLRGCALAVLTSGNLSDDPGTMFGKYPDFDIQVLQEDRGIKIELKNAPEQAFVDGRIIRGINELLVAVVRDIV